MFQCNWNPDSDRLFPQHYPETKVLFINQIVALIDSVCIQMCNNSRVLDVFSKNKMWMDLRDAIMLNKIDSEIYSCAMLCEKDCVY